MDTEADTWKEVVITGEVHSLLSKSEMTGILLLMKALPAETKASLEPGLESSRLSSSLSRFYGLIFSPIAPQFDRLLDPHLREHLRSRIVARICEEYSLVKIILSPMIFYNHLLG